MHPQAPLDTLVRCGRWLAFFVAGGVGGGELGSLLEVQLVKLYARCCDADCSMPASDARSAAPTEIERFLFT